MGMSRDTYTACQICRCIFLFFDEHLISRFEDSTLRLKTSAVVTAPSSSVISSSISAPSASSSSSFSIAGNSDRNRSRRIDGFNTNGDHGNQLRTDSTGGRKSDDKDIASSDTQSTHLR